MTLARHLAVLGPAGNEWLVKSPGMSRLTGSWQP